MAASERVKIIALALMIWLLSACVSQKETVIGEEINEPMITAQVNGASLQITPTPFLPEPAISPSVNDDVAIRAALTEQFGFSEDDTGIALAKNTGMHAKGEIGEEYFLAYKDEDSWIIVYKGLANPPCQAIIDSQFPVEMVPECMDEENNVVIRVQEIEAALRIALADRIGIGTEEMEVMITEASGKHLEGRVNNGYFFAVMRDGDWLIVYDGPIPPPCKEIEENQFPTDMVPQCLDNNNKLVTR